ncbi:MAG: hypothetical protein R3F56_12810 [Planctomycetota bacterium]
MAPLEPRAPFPLRTCLHVALGFVLSAAAFHAWPHDPCTVLNPVAGEEDPLALHPQLAAKKVAGETRILFVGASLTFGYPYGLHASFANVVEAGLRAVWPERNLVVKAIAKPAIDSTRIADMVDAALAAEPDALWVVVGGNEVGARLFLERNLVPDDWLGRLADHGTRSRGLFLRLAPRAVHTEAFAGGDVLGAVLDKLYLAGPARPVVQGLPVPAGDRAVLAERTHASLRRMARAARERRVPLAFLLSPYDLAGGWPRGMTELAPEVDAAVLAWRRGEKVERAVVEELVRAHPQRADAHFLLGRVLLAAGDWAAARRELVRARDLDPAPLHLIGEVERAIAEEGAAWGVPVLVPDEGTYTSGTEVQDPACFLDPAHWNLDGIRGGATRIAELLAERGVVPPLPEGWRATFDAAARAYLQKVVTEQARAYCEAEMARATGAYHMLFGNVRDGVFPLVDGVSWFTGIVEGPHTTMWSDWATRVLFCAAAAAGRSDELQAGTHDDQVARIEGLSRGLWRAAKAGQGRAFVWRLLGGESLSALQAPTGG